MIIALILVLVAFIWIAIRPEPAWIPWHWRLFDIPMEHLLHFGGFFVVALLFSRGWLSVTLLAIVAVAMEFAQEWLAQGRSLDWTDMKYNLAGVVLGTILIKAIQTI